MNNDDLLKDAPPWAQALYGSSNLHYEELTQKVAGLESINKQVLTTNEQLKAKVDLLETSNKNVNEELKQLRRTVEGTFPK